MRMVRRIRGWANGFLGRIRRIAARGAKGIYANPRASLSVAAAFVCLATCATLLAGMREVLARRDDFRVPLLSASWRGIPHWASSEATAALQAALSDNRRESSASVFDADLCERVARRVERLAWVRRVVAVERQGGRGLRVTVEWRSPFLWVADAGGAGGSEGVLLDRDGVAVSPEGYLPEAREVPILRGLRGTADVAENRLLQSVYEILSLYEKDGIGRNFPGAAVTEVRILPPGQGRSVSEIVLVTAAGVPVRFTASPGPGRLFYAEQIANLREVLARDPDLSEVREYVDVRFSRPVYR